MNETLHSPDDPRWGQDNRERKADALYRTLQLHTGHLPDSAVWLDIGCGSGGIAATLAPRVKRMVGIDPESWQRWQSFEDSHANLEFHSASYRELKSLLGPESVDVIICNQVYEHVDNPAALLQAIHAVLKPDGLCYFAGPNLLWPIEPHVFWPFVHWLPRRLAIGMMKRLGSRRADNLDAWLWPYGRLVRAFHATGFSHASAVRERVQAMQGRSSVVQWLGRMPNWLYSTLLPVSPGFVFVLRKNDG